MKTEYREKEVTQIVKIPYYVADDGTKWDTEEEAKNRDELINWIKNHRVKFLGDLDITVVSPRSEAFILNNLTDKIMFNNNISSNYDLKNDIKENDGSPKILFTYKVGTDINRYAQNYYYAKDLDEEIDRITDIINSYSITLNNLKNIRNDLKKGIIDSPNVRRMKFKEGDIKEWLRND